MNVVASTHTVEHNRFHQTKTCLAQLTLGPYVVYSRSRNNLDLGRGGTLVLQRVEKLHSLWPKKSRPYVASCSGEPVDNIFGEIDK